MRQQRGLLVLALSVIALFGGCAEPEPEAVTVEPPAAEVYASPKAVTRAALECIQDELNAVAARDKTEAARCRERLLALAAREHIEKRIAAAPPMFKVVVGDDVVRGYVDYWGAAIAYYAKEFDFEHMLATPKRGDQNTVVVHLKATGETDYTFLEVLTRKDAVGRWGVSRIDFVDSDVTRAATSQPSP